MNKSDLLCLYTWLLGVNIGFMVSTWFNNRYISLAIGLAFLLTATIFRVVYL